jgi:hypothetical protein
MNQSHIKQLFKQRYDQVKWKQFLGETFANTQLFSIPEPLVDIDHNVAANVQRLGQIILNQDEIERSIALYEVTLAPGIVLERNRVGLRNLLRKYWKDIDAAFIVYHHTDKNNWRFTYVSELTGYDASGEFVEIKTEPKRYTYLLGEDQSVRTAVDRFQKIRDKGNKLSLEDVKEAFSVEKLSKIFFDEYKAHYKKFCDYMIAQPGISQTIFNGDEKAIRDFNKKLLGRIVFLYFIQKKGWLGVPVGENWGKGDFNFLTRQFQNFKNKELFYQEFLSVLFFDTLNTKRQNDLIELVKNKACRIPYLNGGLFEEENKNHRNLIFPVNLFESLFDFFDQYNFTIYEDDPNDHTIAVDPEMLGHIFENLLEDNKDKGAYYTPKEIVHYMCQESLIEYLTTWFENRGYEIIGYASLGRSNEPQLFPINEMRTGQLEIEIPIETPAKNIDRILIEKLLKKALDDQDKALVQKHSAEFHLALDSVKICDPAIGSGAFPMGLLHEIFTAKQTLHSFEFGNTKTFDASAVKLNIIQNSIYGVDIERGAVDIARLRFWLSLIVDEDQPKALPNLDYKIVVGNSLVSKLNDDVINIDWEMKGHKQINILYDVLKPEEILKQISQEQKKFFSPDSDKKKLAADIRNLKIDLLVSQLELMVKSKGMETKPTSTGKTLTKQTEIYLQTISWKNTITQLKKLKTKPELSLDFFDWKLDFPEVMNGKVVDQVGFDIVIGNPPYIRGTKFKALSDYFKKNYISAQYQVDLYVLFIELGINILKNQGVLSFITPNSWLKNSSMSELRKLMLQKLRLLVISSGLSDIFNAKVDTTIFIVKNTQKLNTILNIITIKNSEFKLLRTIDQSRFLKNDELIFDIEANNQVSMILKKIKLNGYTLESQFKITRGINPYDKYKGQSEEIIKKRLYHSNIKKDHTFVPEIRGKHIGKYFHQWDAKHYISYGEWLAAPREAFFFTGQRIVIREILGKTFICTLITEDLKIDRSLYIAKPIDDTSCRYVLGVLASYPISWFFRYEKNEFDDLFPKIRLGEFKNLPIPNATKSEQKAIEILVQKCLDAKGKDVTKWEQQIDNLVYKLYELTYEEVKIIDPEFPLTEQEYQAITIESTP